MKDLFVVDADKGGAVFFLLEIGARAWIFDGIQDGQGGFFLADAGKVLVQCVFGFFEVGAVEVDGGKLFLDRGLFRLYKRSSQRLYDPILVQIRFLVCRRWKGLLAREDKREDKVKEGLTLAALGGR